MRLGGGYRRSGRWSARRRLVWLGRAEGGGPVRPALDGNQTGGVGEEPLRAMLHSFGLFLVDLREEIKKDPN